MAAAEAKEFWEDELSIDRITHPPESWPRICAGGVSWRADYVWKWLETDEAKGSFCWHYQNLIWNDDLRTGLVFAFSDHRTAMAFKLKFG